MKRIESPALGKNMEQSPKYQVLKVIGKRAEI
jgi:hypothetical protein